VRFLDDEFEGREDWVPPARLKVLWAESERWLAREGRWIAVRDASATARETIEHRAAQLVIGHVEALTFLDSQDMYRDAVLTVDDQDAFRAHVGFDPADLLEEEAAFVDENGSIVAPSSGLVRAVERAAVLHADVLLQEFDRERLRWEERAMYG